MKIILGTAHLATTPGKCSPDKKFREYAYSREIVTLVETALKAKGYDVLVDYRPTEPNSYMKSANKRTEANRELAYRVGVVNEICKKHGAKNCVYVSIHVNAAAGDGKWHGATGFSVFVSNNCSDNSKRLARLFTSLAKENKQIRGNRCIPSSLYWQKNLYVLKNTLCPAVLTENLFQDNREDVAFLTSDEGRQAIVNMHVKAKSLYADGYGK